MRHDEFTHVRPAYPRPTFDEATGLWLYGNGILLKANRAYVACACSKGDWTADELKAVGQMAENLVLDGKILVCGVHSEGHRRAATEPLKWGSPRVLAFSGGFKCHLGHDLRDEPFREARLWRYEWDPLTDLAVSKRPPEKPQTFSSVNLAVDRLIGRLAGPGGARFADGRPPEREPDPVLWYGRSPASR